MDKLHIGSGRMVLPFVCWSCVFSCIAQPYWVTVGFPSVPQLTSPVQQVYANESKDTIYYVGSFRLDTGEYWFGRNPVLRYAQGHWDTLGYVNGFIRTVVIYHDTLIAGGTFYNSFGNEVFEDIAYWANGGWHAYGTFESGISKLRVLDDTLYAMGGFHAADGHECMGIARRDGSNWVNVGEVQDPDLLMKDLIKYNGQLYAFGNGILNGAQGFFQFVGGQWLGVSPGIPGGVSHIESMAIFQGDLYVGGQILIQEGNSGQGIMRWDGSQFYPVALGLQAHFNDFVSISNATCMTVHNGLLWVGGGFNYASGVSARGVAAWDGTQWCGVPGDLTSSFGGAVSSLDFYYDTLFVACGDTADGLLVNKGAKFIGSSYIDSCGATVGPLDIVNMENSTLVARADAMGHWSVTGGSQGIQSLILCDAAGHVVVQTAVHVSAERPLLIDFGELDPGIYVLRIGDRSTKIFVLRL